MAGPSNIKHSLDWRDTVGRSILDCFGVIVSLVGPLTEKRAGGLDVINGTEMCVGFCQAFRMWKKARKYQGRSFESQLDNLPRDHPRAGHALGT